MTIIYNRQKIVVVAAELDWNTSSFEVGVMIAASIPSGSRFVVARLFVQTQFNAGTTNTLKIGYAAGGGELIPVTSIGVAANTFIDLPTAWSVNPLSAERALYATYTQSGTAASAGKVHVNLIAVL